MQIDPRIHTQARFNTLVLSLSAAAGIAIFVALMLGGLVYSTGYLFLGLKQLEFAYAALGLSVLVGIGAGIHMAISGYRNQYPVELADLMLPADQAQPEVEDTAYPSPPSLEERAQCKSRCDEKPAVATPAS